jgi:hypothetical protein
MMYVCMYVGYPPEGYTTKDAYSAPPPPGYAQGYPPAGYPLPQPQPQVVYTQAPPPQKEVGCLEGWLVSLPTSLSLSLIIHFGLRTLSNDIRTEHLEYWHNCT